MQFLREVTVAVREVSFSDLTEYGKIKLRETVMGVKLKTEELYCKVTGQKTPQEKFEEFNEMLKESLMSDEEYEQLKNSYEGFVEVENPDPSFVSIDGEKWEMLDTTTASGSN